MASIAATAVMNEESHKDPFVRSVAARLKECGLPEAEFVSSTPESPNFGDAEAIFRLGPLILRFIRDRGQEFVELAFDQAPERFFLFDDVDIAMGWKTIDEVLAKEEPEKLERVLDRLARHIAELKTRFSGAPVRLTQARLERAERDRGEAFMKRLQDKQ